MPRITFAVLFGLFVLGAPAAASDFVVPLGEPTSVDIPLGFKLPCKHEKTANVVDPDIISVDPRSPSKKPDMVITGHMIGATTFTASFFGQGCPGSFSDSYSVLVVPGDDFLDLIGDIGDDVVQEARSQGKDLIKGCKSDLKELLKTAKKNPTSWDEFADDATDILFGGLSDADEIARDAIDTFRTRFESEGGGMHFGDFGTALPDDVFSRSHGSVRGGLVDEIAIWSEALGDDLLGLFHGTLDKADKVLEGTRPTINTNVFLDPLLDELLLELDEALWDDRFIIPPRPIASVSNGTPCVPNSRGLRVLGRGGDFDEFTIRGTPRGGDDIDIDIDIDLGDDFELNIGDSLGTGPGTDDVLNPGSARFIFQDGFESGDTAAWTSDIP